MMGLGPPPGTAPKDPNVKVQVTETDDLRSTKIAFILGRRSSAMAGVQPGATGAALEPGRNFNEDPGMLPNDTDYGFQLAIHNNYAPGVPGTERFQKLCSFEYLHRYFTNVLCNKAVLLSKTVDTSAWDSGVLRQTKSMIARITAQNLTPAAQANGGAGALPAVSLATNSMMNMPDLAQQLALPGSDGADKTKTPELRQGIFARDTGPFLRGKGSGGTGMIACTAAGVPQAVMGEDKATQPYHLSRCMGDEVAFAQLERHLEQLGVTDWRPDGIVLSLGANDPSDQLSDEFFGARDGQLYNMRIQGPAHTTTWTGDPAMEVLPGDKVFIAIVADVWFDTKELKGDLAKIKKWLDSPTSANWNDYAEERDKYFKNNLLTEDEMTNFHQMALQVFKGKKESTVLTNFRVITTTSSQMINYSPLKWMNSENPATPTKRRQAVDRAPENESVTLIQGASRMGLRLGEKGGEYIIGAWQIGTVLDSAASRAVMPGGSFTGVRTAPNTMAHNVYVNIGWWSADRLWRTYMNVEGTVKPRYIKNIDQPQNPVNIPPGKANSAHN